MNLNTTEVRLLLNLVNEELYKQQSFRDWGAPQGLTKHTETLNAKIDTLINILSQMESTYALSN